jgi:Domain of unknown function (DUF4259)
MGSYGPGPFDSDTASDFASEVRHASDPEARADVLHFAMRNLVQAEGLVLARYADYELESEVERAVAAVAFIADQVRERCHWTNTADARGCTGEPPYDLLPAPELAPVSDTLWISAMAVLDKVDLLLAPDDSAGEYRKNLAALRDDLRHREPTD